MTHLECAPFSLETPAGWQDRTIVAFVAPPVPGERTASNIVVAREPRRAGETLHLHVQRQVLALAEDLDDFDMHGSEDVRVAGRVAVQTRCTWTAGDTVIEQVVIHVEPDEGETMVMTLTCTSSVESAPTVMPVFSRVIASMQPSGRRAIATPVPPPLPGEIRRDFTASPMFSMPGVRALR